MTVKLYVEGGGDSDALRRKCREGFNGFLKNAGFKGRMPRLVACGGRQQALDRFASACKAGETCMILIDSETPVSAGTSPWRFLADRSGERFTQPSNATDDQCHFMVVCMESWFLADKHALATYFGRGFNASALPRSSQVESIPKSDVLAGLKSATAHCTKKSPYAKGRHSFGILLLLAPDEVALACPWAKRFLYALDAVMAN